LGELGGGPAITKIELETSALVPVLRNAVRREGRVLQAKLPDHAGTGRRAEITIKAKLGWCGVARCSAWMRGARE